MDKKKRKKENPVLICLDCGKETNDFYKIATNRGDLIKCANCYELWICRSNRKQSTPNPNITEAS